MSTWATLNIQNSASPIIENLIFFHDHALIITSIITILILYIIISLLLNTLNNKFILHNQIIEFIWTILPIFILIFLAIPSLKILYLTDEIQNPTLTIKTIGHQWYWRYEYSDFPNIEFNSYLLQYKLQFFRLLDVENRIVIPYNVQIRLLVSSSDVIHSWTVPALGIKVDAVPGRINQTIIFLNRPGIYFGQCSEICGINHRFMPIVVERTNKINFLRWLNYIFLLSLDDWK